MPKEVDNSSARQAARQAARQSQRTSRAKQTTRQQGTMGIGQGASGPSFGQILQKNLSTPDPSRGSQLMETPEEKPEERPADSRHKADKGKQQARQGKVDQTGRHRESRDQSESRDDSKGEGQKDSSKHAKEAERRVIAKQGQRESGSERGSQQDKGQQGRQGAGQQVKGQAKASAGKGQSQSARPDTAKPLVTQAGTMATSSGLTKSAKSPHLPKTLPQRLLEQIVSYARLLSRADGEKEMELALRDEIFRGLRLRILTKKGKIKATFVTSSRDVHDLFQSERQALTEALSEKGLEVEEIDVIMT